MAEPIKVKDALFVSKLITTQTRPCGGDQSEDQRCKNLYLTVSDGGDSYACDWADWAYPRLLEANGEETKLTDLNWKSAKTAWGKVNLHKNCGGGSLTKTVRLSATGLGHMRIV